MIVCQEKIEELNFGWSWFRSFDWHNRIYLTLHCILLSQIEMVSLFHIYPPVPVFRYELRMANYLNL